jgi:hypothetical protein
MKWAGTDRLAEWSRLIKTRSPPYSIRVFFRMGLCILKKTQI